VDETASTGRRRQLGPSAAGGTSVPGCKASKGGLTVLSGAEAADDLKSRPALLDHSGRPGALESRVRATLPVLRERNDKAWVAALGITTWCPEYFKCTVETYRSEKNLLVKPRLLTDNAPGHARALMK